MSDLELMIILIEGEYPRSERNTPFKMKNLILKEFNISYSEQDILKFYGLVEDYSMQNRQVEYYG